MKRRRRPDRYLTPAERQDKEAAGKAAQAASARELEERLLAEGPSRTEAAKPRLHADLDNLAVTLENIRGALDAAHVFDVRAVGECLRSALAEFDRAERRIVEDSGLQVV